MNSHCISHIHSEEKSERLWLANVQEEMKIVANLKDKMTKNKECQCLTKAICDLGNVLILKLIVLNKISDKLKIIRFQNPKLRISQTI